MPHLSRLTEICAHCRYVKTCDHKEMLAYFEDADAISGTNADMPALRETVNTIINGKVVKIYKDDVEKELYKSVHQILMEAT